MILLVGFVLLFAQFGFAQTLKDRVESVFNDVLTSLQTIPGTEHGQHFIAANVEASARTINALSNFISTNISAFPLSSTAAGLTFDFSTGVPVSTATSLGPIFAERAQTLGRGRINIGFNFSFLNLNKIRGTRTKDLRFTFTHSDVGELGTFGDSINELDTMDLFMDLKLNASILNFLLTFGVTNRLDLGVAVPFVNVSLEADPLAVMNSYTFARNDSANHLFFGGTPQNPDLTFRPGKINDDATGVGDIAFRAKYNFLRGRNVDLTAMFEYRPSVGDNDNFLGSGDPTFRAALITSSIIGDFAPHLNLAYENRQSKLDRDEIEFTAGYDQKISESLTIILELLGQFEIGSEIEELSFPQTQSIEIRNSAGTQVGERDVSLTNIPHFAHDNVVNGAFGLKINPKREMVILANVFFPLNDGGLRSNFIPTIGFEFSF